MDTMTYVGIAILKQRRNADTDRAILAQGLTTNSSFGKQCPLSSALCPSSVTAACFLQYTYREEFLRGLGVHIMVSLP
jgi:hypothetical protein